MDRFTGLQKQAGRLPRYVWAVGGVVLVSLGAVAALEFSGPPYAVLEEGLTPADGGKVIAQLQKLGIPYQLQAAGNVILVPAPQLAQARLQLGQAQVPESDAATAWTQLENAPMTASDLAQSTMQSQALQLSLQQSIEMLSGVRAAQVFLAMPPDTPFLADQPRPSASVIITADDAIAQAQGEAIAALVAGAVPGLDAHDVTVTTNSGLTVFPRTSAMATQEQLAATESVENEAAAQISGLLTALVGAGNFQTGVSANLDFTQDHTHQIVYGPGHVIQHQSLSTSTQTGQKTLSFGIPGAMSNEPPPATTANPAPVPAQGAPATQGNAAQSPATQAPPQQSSSNQDQTYLTDQSESDITNPEWSVKSLAVSVVLNKAALGTVTPEQVKSAILGVFAYPSVNVNVLAASISRPATVAAPGWLAQTNEPLTHSVLEVLTAIFLLFGVAMPASRRLASVNLQSLLTLPPPPPPPPPMPTPMRPLPAPRDYTELRDRASENISGVAHLLQSWTEETEG